VSAIPPPGQDGAPVRERKGARQEFDPFTAADHELEQYAKQLGFPSLPPSSQITIPQRFRHPLPLAPDRSEVAEIVEQEQDREARSWASFIAAPVLTAGEFADGATLVHPEARGLLASILMNLDDDAPRLILADWLDEHENPEWARFIRAQIQGFEIEPILEKVHVGQSSSLFRLSPPWRVGPNDKIGVSPLPGGVTLTDQDVNTGAWVRGFLASIECDAGDFVAFGGPLFRFQPITTVRLRGKKPPRRGNGYTWFFYPDSAPWDDRPESVPRSLFELLDARWADSYGDLRFRTAESAIRAISTGCVEFGRATASVPLRQPSFESENNDAS
jgi:uncharacterized protein (TIGR02996 family)